LQEGMHRRELSFIHRDRVQFYRIQAKKPNACILPAFRKLEN
jgi:hypothetical protein